MDGKINIFLHGLEGKTMTLILKQDSTIDELFEEAKLKTGIPLAEMRLIFGGRQLPQGQGKTLNDFGMKNMSTVVMVLRLRGGSDMSVTALPPFIQLTTTMEDMISLDSDPDTARAIMPCGHCIGRESMKSYCDSELSSGHATFRCPDKQCQSEWDYSLVRHVAGLSPEEEKMFGTRMAENYLNKNSGIRQCPRCASYCERQDHSNQRVACPFCGKSEAFEFCWICLRDWSGQDHGYCGMNEKLKYLATCRTKTIIGVSNCPAMRACPSCGVLIEHTEACKHMDCKGCKNSFCFICLKPAINGSYQCGAHNTPCIPAPVQTKL